jgi:hypothetical protein
VKLCPYCSSQIQEDALQCPDCQRWLDPKLDSTLNADSAPLVLPPRRISGLAIGSLACAIFGIGPGSIAAVILGYLARREIRRDPLRIDGKGLATAGIILGWMGIFLLCVLLVLAIYWGLKLERTHKKEETRETHLIGDAPQRVPVEIQSAARAAYSRGALELARCSRVVISQEDGSANSRLTNCVCSAWPALRASTLPNSGNPRSAKSPIKSNALCLPNSSG